LGPTKAKRGVSHIRPTSDRTREAVFNIIGDKRLLDGLVLDIFAGTGALGLEALSRGAAAALFVDHSRESLRLTAANAERSALESRALLARRDLNRGLGFIAKMDKIKAAFPDGRAAFDLVFIDPPYERFQAAFFLEELQEYNLLRPGAMVLYEDRSKAKLPERVGALTLVDQRRYGDSGVWFYQGG